MIQNLNQVSFQKFGALLPDRNKGTPVADDSKKLTLDPLQNDFPVHRAAADTTLYLADGKSVLSVSNDGDSFLHFYFDKPVCIKTNTYFCLFPFMGEAAVLMKAAAEPILSGRRPNGSLRLDRDDEDYVHGNGRCKIEVDTVSGNVTFDENTAGEGHQL